ncbi:major capsid protein [Chicken microvirus mg7_8]|nr:major capsid protein [Chicken microvirus mg7_8]
MPNILKNPNYRARLGRHGHDLSRRLLFTSSVGQLLPVLNDFLLKGDKVRLNESVFTRTQPLKTPAFVRCTEHIYYFFVPMKQMNAYWEQAYFGIQDIMNTNDIPLKYDGSGNGAQVPMVSAGGYFRLPLIDNSCISLQDLLRGLFGVFSRSSGTITDVNIQSKFYIVGQTGNAGRFPVYAKNTAVSSSLDQYNIPMLWNAIRLLDLLGYGGRLYSSVDGNVVKGDGSIGPLEDYTKNKLGGIFQVKVNLYSLAAYQKIFYDFFRLSKFTANSPYAYNFSRYNSSVSTYDGRAILNYDLRYFNVDTTNDSYRYHGLFELHYHPFKKDFFTNIETTPLFDLSGTGINSYTDGRNTVSNDELTPSLSDLASQVLSTYGVQRQNITETLTGRSNANVSSSGIETIAQGESPSVQQLRLAYAYDRLLAITQRGGRHVDDQYAAHFGSRPPQGVSDEVYYLGSHSSPLKIGEVVATAAGSADSRNTSVLGELAGRGLGVSSKNKDITFTAPCHGILMAIYSCVPDIEYRDTGIDRKNFYTSINDYPHPEFDNLGMQPLFNVQSNIHLVGVNTANSIFGWQYRYSELKLAYDRICGAFNYTLIDWTSATYFGEDVATGGYLDIGDIFYVSPNFLNRIMALDFNPPLVSADGINRVLLGYCRKSYGSATDTPNIKFYTLANDFFTDTVYERDPLLHSIDFKYYKTSCLSTYGLPNI